MIEKLSKILSGVALVMLATTGFSAGSKVVRSIAIKLSPDRHEIKDLKKRGYRIAGVDYEKNQVAILLNEDEEILEGDGYDIQSIETINTTNAPEDGYHTYDEVVAQLQSWQNAHPSIMKMEAIGSSGEGRDIYAVKISDNVDQHESAEPAILFNAMHHAREVMTVEVAIDIVEQLVTGYDNDANIRKWVDGNEIWVIPMFNPDGNNKVWTEDNMWRKNTREGHGVDLNRNYPYAWNSCNGSSDYKFADDYHGPSAASEPEVQAMMGFVGRIKPVFNISYHSYSELVIYPYGCSGERTADRATVEGIGKDLAEKLVRDSGQGHYDPGTPWELLYAVDGGDIDWMYHEHGVIPYVIEVNSMRQGFQPEYSWRQPTVTKMRAGWQFLLEKLGQSGIRGRVADVSAGKVIATNLAAGGARYETMIHQDGSYHLLAPAGMYRLDYVLNGETRSQNVIIGGSRLDLL